MSSDRVSEDSDCSHAGAPGSYELLPSQKNDIARLIRGQRFQLSDFQWRVETVPPHQELDPSGTGGKIKLGRGMVSVLVHNPTNFYFTFDTRRYGVFRGVFSPSDYRRHGAFATRDWEALVRNVVNPWLRWVKRECKYPDPWGEISRQPDLSQALDSATEEAFTLQEQYRVDAVLDHLGQDFAQQMADAPDRQRTQLGRLEEGIAFLRDEARTQSKRNWYFMLLGVMVTISVGLQPDQWKALVQMLGTAVNQIFGGPALLQ